MEFSPSICSQIHKYYTCSCLLSVVPREGTGLSAVCSSSTGYIQVVFTSDYLVGYSGFVASWRSGSTSSTFTACAEGVFLGPLEARAQRGVQVLFYIHNTAL